MYRYRRGKIIAYTGISVLCIEVKKPCTSLIFTVCSSPQCIFLLCTYSNTNFSLLYVISFIPLVRPTCSCVPLHHHDDNSTAPFSDSNPFRALTAANLEQFSCLFQQGQISSTNYVSQLSKSTCFGGVSSDSICFAEIHDDAAGCPLSSPF